MNTQKQRSMRFSLNNLRSKMVLRELVHHPGFIICGRNVNSMRYANDILLMTDSERKLEDLLHELIKES